MKGAGVMVQTKEPILVPFSKFELEVRKGIAWPDGPKVQIRAVSPGDEDGLREMFSRLSRESINKRFHLPMPRVPDWALAISSMWIITTRSLSLRWWATR